MSMDDSAYIKRLKERLRQKPESKVFLSLAEELRKHDRIDDAIAVLIDGIKKNPGFVAARLTLGRWYLAGAMFQEAKKEFLDVLAKDPGNVFAHKGLAEVSRNLGLPESTAEEHPGVVEISTDDSETLSVPGSEPEPAGVGAGTEEAIPEESVRELSPSEEVEEIEVPEEDRADETSELIREAECFIAGGHYDKALDLYNTILSDGGGDRRVLQLKKELIALIRLTGRDKEIIISRLNRFSALVRDRFAVRREDRKSAAVERLGRLLDSIKVRYAQKEA